MVSMGSDAGLVAVMLAVIFWHGGCAKLNKVHNIKHTKRIVNLFIGCFFEGLVEKMGC
jgi:hypothetical protein